MWTITVMTAAIVALGSFTWALRRHFRVAGSMPPGMRALTMASGAAALLFIVLVIRQGAEPAGGAASTLLSIAAIALFWWAVAATRRLPPHLAHTGDTPDMIHDAGPYGYVRHPFYLSYCLFWAGTAIVAGGLQWIAALALIVWYFITARSEEARFLESPVAARYAQYQSRTGMILPRITGSRTR